MPNADIVSPFWLIQQTCRLVTMCPAGGFRQLIDTSGSRLIDRVGHDDSMNLVAAVAAPLVAPRVFTSGPGAVGGRRCGGMWFLLAPYRGQAVGLRQSSGAVSGSAAILMEVSG